MATSSITKNFVVSGAKQVEMFVNAIEGVKNQRSYNHNNCYFFITVVAGVLVYLFTH